MDRSIHQNTARLNLKFALSVRLTALPTCRPSNLLATVTQTTIRSARHIRCGFHATRNARTCKGTSSSASTGARSMAPPSSSSIPERQARQCHVPSLRLPKSSSPSSLSKTAFGGRIDLRVRAMVQPWSVRWHMTPFGGCLLSYLVIVLSRGTVMIVFDSVRRKCGRTHHERARNHSIKSQYESKTTTTTRLCDDGRLWRYRNYGTCPTPGACVAESCGRRGSLRAEGRAASRSSPDGSAAKTRRRRDIGRRRAQHLSGGKHLRNGASVHDLRALAWSGNRLVYHRGWHRRKWRGWRRRHVVVAWCGVRGVRGCRQQCVRCFRSSLCVVEGRGVCRCLSNRHTGLRRLRGLWRGRLALIRGLERLERLERLQ